MEGVGLTMLRMPVENALRQARAVLEGRVVADKQAAAMKDIEGYAREVLQKTSPQVIDRAKKLAATTVAPILMEKFSEDELRQLVAFYESPVKVKFEALIPDLEKALGQKLGAEQGPIIKPKMEELQNKIGERLRAAVTP